VLREITGRLCGCLREVDFLARTGGDQFAMLLHHGDAPGAETMARRVIEATARPCRLEGSEFTVTCSIGIALCPTDGLQADDLVRRAETAMQRAKEGGRAGYRFHQARGDAQGADLRSRMRLDHAMRQALARDRFRLHYQPQVDLADGSVIGAEALLRWRDDELGDVSPAHFIPVAEDSGFIVAIGDWVLDQAVRQAADWHRRGIGLPVAVNVSALQFQQASFVERVAAALERAGLPAPRLELELTESILVRDADEALHRLQALSQLGVKLAIDDFGTGYSSLAYLKRFPIEKLKIDRSFVKGLPADDSDAGIVRAIIQMARALGLRVIAEGVETESQRRFLVRAGCDQFQGFLHAPALAGADFEQRVLANPVSTAVAGVSGLSLK
jgi:EAL domain-containing protein (putative c-di-GMP-specific phosphodiesterase class I)